MMPPDIYASASYTVEELDIGARSCLAAPHCNIVPRCCSGLFHTFFRTSLELAKVIRYLPQEAKLDYILKNICSRWPKAVSGVCEAQATNAWSGLYVLDSPWAHGYVSTTEDMCKQ